MLIAQITDLHITAPGGRACGGIDTSEPVAAVVAQLNALHPRPDLVLVTGDIVDTGKPEEYAVAADLLDRIEMPVRILPGNHDDRGNLRRAFAPRGWVPADDGPFIQQVIEDLPLRIVMLDSVIPGHTDGELDDARLEWLRRRLAEAPDHPTMVAMHHPPFVSGMPGLDRYRCANGDRLAAIIEAYPNVLALVCGHLHRPVSIRWAGTLAFVAPSAARQIALRMGTDMPFAWTAEPPALALHLYRGAEGLVSLTRGVGEEFAPASVRNS